MTPRQLYAITHPLTDPSDINSIASIESGLKQFRRHPKGPYVLSILAVDR
jgi:hypothetical protein